VNKVPKYQRSANGGYIIMKRIICLILAFMTLLSLASCGGAKDSQEKIFEEAMAKMEAKSYDEAIALFESIEQSEDAEEMAKECKYLKAEQMILQGSYELAYDLLYAIKGYKDSSELLKDFVWKYTKMTVTYDGNKDMAAEYTYTYDEKGYELMTVYENSTGSGSYTYVNVYDDNGRIKRITRTSDVGYVVIYNYTYNALGQVSCLSSNYDGSYIQDIYYTYDDRGNVIKEEIPDTETVNKYTYDDKGNMLTSDCNYGETVYANSYNDQGQLIKTVREINGISTVVTYTYDDHGNLIKEEAVEEERYSETNEYFDYKLFFIA